MSASSELLSSVSSLSSISSTSVPLAPLPAFRLPSVQLEITLNRRRSKPDSTAVSKRRNGQAAFPAASSSESLLPCSIKTINNRSKYLPPHGSLVKETGNTRAKKLIRDKETLAADMQTLAAIEAAATLSVISRPCNEPTKSCHRRSNYGDLSLDYDEFTSTSILTNDSYMNMVETQEKLIYESDSDSEKPVKLARGSKRKSS